MVLIVPSLVYHRFRMVARIGARIRLYGFRMLLIVPLVGPSAFGVVFVWFPYALVSCSYGLIVPLVGSSAFDVVFVWFSYSFVRFSYGCNRPPRWSIGFRARFRMVFIWLGIVFVWF